MSDKKRKVERKRALASKRTYEDVFRTDAGKKVLWDIMKEGGMLGTSFVPGDPYATAYNEGNRQIALYILSRLNINIQRLDRYIEEAEKNYMDYELFNDEE